MWTTFPPAWPRGYERRALLQGSVVDSEFLTRALREARPDGVIHLASKKSPTESVSEPLLYGEQNVVAYWPWCGRCAPPEAPGSSSRPAARCMARPTRTASARTHPRLPSAHTVTPSSTASGCAGGGQRLRLGVVRLRYFNVVGAAEPGLIDTGASTWSPGCSPVCAAEAPCRSTGRLADARRRCACMLTSSARRPAHVRAIDVLERGLTRLRRRSRSGQQRAGGAGRGPNRQRCPVSREPRPAGQGIPRRSSATSTASPPRSAGRLVGPRRHSRLGLGGRARDDVALSVARAATPYRQWWN